MDALKGARFVQIPFSASTLGPRNAPAAVDLAMAALHVRTGSLTATRESGVGSFSPTFLQSHIEGRVGRNDVEIFTGSLKRVLMLLMCLRLSMCV